jgi:hypothetical protein
VLPTLIAPLAIGGSRSDAQDAIIDDGHLRSTNVSQRGLGIMHVLLKIVEEDCQLRGEAFGARITI